MAALLCVDFSEAMGAMAVGPTAGEGHPFEIGYVGRHEDLCTYA